MFCVDDSDMTCGGRPGVEAHFGLCSATSRCHLSMPSARGSDMTLRRDVREALRWTHALWGCGIATSINALSAWLLAGTGLACSPRAQPTESRHGVGGMWDRDTPAGEQCCHSSGAFEPLCADKFPKKVRTRARSSASHQTHHENVRVRALSPPAAGKRHLRVVGCRHRRPVVLG